MTSINNLTSQDTIASSDQFAIYANNTGNTRRVSASALATFVQDQTSSSGGLLTQYATPTATGQTTIVNPPTQGASVWLQMTPQGAYANGTITFPAAAVAIDGQEVLVTSTLAVTTLAVNFLDVSGVSTAVVGAPTALTANSFFRMRFDPIFKLWVRIG